MQIRVYYEDTDTGGVVYHCNYLSFCERARSEIFFQKGLSPVLKNGHFVAKKVEADYYLSAKLGDLLDIDTKLIELKGASFKLLQTIYLKDKKIFELKITLVYINFEAKPIKIDTDTRELIVSLFSSK
jgi:acyl-CoA thioester hydrolase